MAFAAAAIPYLTAGAAIVSTIGAIQQANSASNADKYNAKVAQQNAQLATQNGQLQLQQQQTDAYRKLGAIKAGSGASGVTTDGSPMDILADSYTQSELDANTIIYNSKIKANGYTNSAELDLSAASDAKTAGYTKAASNALLGGTKTYDSFVKYS
jgi:hypothetical protein